VKLRWIITAGSGVVVLFLAELLLTYIWPDSRFAAYQPYLEVAYYLTLLLEIILAIVLWFKAPDAHHEPSVLLLLFFSCVTLILAVILYNVPLRALNFAVHWLGPILP
jgi:hypothetical protein